MLLLCLWVLFFNREATNAYALPQQVASTPSPYSAPPVDQDTGQESPRYWKWPRPKVPEARESLTIHGIYPGLYRSEVDRQLGLPERSHRGWGIYNDGQGSTLNVIYRSEVVMSVIGNQVEFEGKLLGMSGHDFPNAGYPSELRVQRDHLDVPAYFELRAPELKSFPRLPTPGSNLKLLDLLSNKDPRKGKALLLENPGLISCRRTPWGDTPLHMIARKGSLTGTRLMLELGGDPNVCTYRGRRPLHGVSSPEKASVLLYAGAELNAEDNYGTTPLTWALRKGNLEVARFLLERGAVVDGAHGAEAMNAAAKFRSSKMVELLLEKGVPVPPLGLHNAAAGGEPSIVARFLAMGADPNARDELDRTPLHHLAIAASDRPNAPCYQHVEALKLLLEAGADPTLRDKTQRNPTELARYHREVSDFLTAREKN